MAWSAGPGNPTSVSIGGTSLDGGLIEGYAVVTEPDSFDAAVGVTLERGSVLKRITGMCYDISAINAINAFMTARSEQTIIATFSDAATITYNSFIVRIKPVVSPVNDVKAVYIAADGTTNSDITAGGAWTNLGPSLGQFTPSFDYAGDSVDGLGRPYYSSVKFSGELILPGTTSILPYALLGAQGHRGVKNQVALEMPDTNFMVYTDAYTSFNYGDEDGVQPRNVRVKIEAAAADFGTILGISDGVVTTPVDEPWDGSAKTLSSDLFLGFEFECVGFHTDEPTLVTV